MSETAIKYRVVRDPDNALRIVEALPGEYAVSIEIAFRQAAALANWGEFQRIDPRLFSK